MKTSVTGRNEKIGLSLFQVAALLDDSTVVKPETSLSEKPLANLMLHPEKLDTVLKVTKIGNPATGRGGARRAMRSPAPKKRAGIEKSSRRSLVKTRFHLKAPQAKSVKLAAGFTDWERFPVDMIKVKDGVWQVVVPLPPGDHSYRFIVDGEWCDDPHPALCVPNPYGTINAIVTVA